MIRNIFLAIGLTGLLFITGCATNPVTGKKDFMLISKNQEVAMGQQADPEITNSMGLYEDKQLQRFIKRKGKKMVDVSHRQDLDYEFKVLDSPVVNAFAVPGGYIYFTRGIMAFFNNEAQFAGVLGHEIGHVAARHSAKQYSKAMLAELGLAVGSVVSPEFAQFSDLARTGLGLLFLKYGRDAERQSDELGVEYSTKIGYDAEEMAGFFNTLDRMRPEGGDVPGFLSTHPHPQERFETVRELANTWQQKLDLENLDVNRDGYLQMIDGITYGPDPREGFVENNTFYHPDLKFKYPVPNGWQVQNTPQQVQMAPESGEAIIILTLQNSKSLNQAVQQVLQNYNLKAIETRRAIVNGFDTQILLAEQILQDQALRLLIYLIEDNNMIYSFLGVTEYNSFNQYQRTFANTMGNFDRVTDPAILNKQPDHIEVEEVQQNARLTKVLSNMGVDQDEMEEIAILNGMSLSSSVSAGTLIKLVE